MKVITYSTHSDGAFEILKESFDNFARNIDELVVLGAGETWKGFGHRILAYRDYAASCDPNEVILCVDAHDVILTGSLQDLENMYRKLGTKKIVMSTERAGFIQKQCLGLSFGLVDDTVICAGVMIGFATSISDTIALICQDKQCEHRRFDDQKEFVHFANNNRGAIVLDKEWDLFATIGGTENPNPEQTMIFNTDGTLLAFEKPVYVLHHPGNSDIRQSVAKLGYSTGKLKLRDHYLYQWIGMVHAIQAFPIFQYLLLSVIIFVFCIFVLIIWWLRKRKTVSKSRGS